MKHFNISLIFGGLLAFGLLTALTAQPVQAAELASAKVLSVEGTVTKYDADGKETPLKVGDILSEGDSVVAASISQAELVFSNGSEVTVSENSSLLLKEMSQESFGGNKSYEQLAADPSQSQTLLELNYGEVRGHVKRLRSGSSFDVDTPLGTAAIRGTTFVIRLMFNAERGEFILTVENEDGLVDLVSRYAGTLNYGQGNVADTGYDSSVKESKSESVPPAHTVIIRLRQSDPYFEDIIDFARNAPPFQNAGTAPEIIVEPPEPPKTPEDPGVTVASPEGPAADTTPLQ